MRHFFHLVFVFLVFSPLITQAQWTDGMNATYVMGQSNFTTATSGSGTQGMTSPVKVAIDLVNNKIYVVEVTNSRVLRFSYPLTGNQPTAELVFGQADFTGTSSNRGSSNPAANTLSAPYGVAVYNGTLWISDGSNNRVLKFNNAHSLSSNGPNADVVLGQSGFTANGFATAQNRMRGPRAVAIDSSGNLWVADFTNNRVLRFDNAASKSSGANADGVLG
ncbi:MAG TPA: hypothetical protein VEC36_08825, partial [Patescibacteria group bacterium]|nr:hypothetical protein [Patescibacteria group bacterium]